MSLNIKDAVYGLGEKLGVDMSGAPASNIADMIDYISNGVGANTGVIAEAVDKLEVGGGGGVPDWIYMVEATYVSSDPLVLRLNKTYKELKQIYDGPFSSNKCIMTMREDEDGEGDFYYYTIVNVGYDGGHDTRQVTDSVSRTFTCDGEDEYPECTM